MLQSVVAFCSLENTFVLYRPQQMSSWFKFFAVEMETVIQNDHSCNCDMSQNNHNMIC